MSTKLLDKKQKNQTFLILNGIAILLVILGHLDFRILTIGGLFPYYSFHVMVFAFVSGYFYKEEATEHPGRYLLHKAKGLLLPYMIWNLIYGLLAAGLRVAGFGFGDPINIRSLFLEPFLGGHQYALNFPSWFVPALFLVQAVNLMGRKIFDLLPARANAFREMIILSGTLIVGILVVYLAQTGHVWGYYKTPGRILFMLPVFEMGVFYRKHLEKRDHVKWYIYFPVLLVIQIAIVKLCGGLAFSAVWVTSFGNLPFVPYLTTVTGIAFWLGIAKRLSESRSLSRLAGAVGTLGNHSFDLMMHHILGFFLWNECLCLMSARGILPGFDREMFLTDVNYVYTGAGMATGLSETLLRGAFLCIYTAFGIMIPLLIGGLQRWIQKKIPG